MKSSGDSTAALRDLISLLTSTELVLLRSKLQKGHKGQPSHACKTASLLEALLKTPDASTAMLGTIIYGQPDDKALKYLRLRLFSKILESLEPAPAATAGEPTEQDIWQQLACTELLWQRGGYQALEAVLPGLVRKAAAVEFHPGLLSALRQYRRLLQWRGEDCTALTTQIAGCLEAEASLQAAEACLSAHPLDLPRQVQVAAIPWSQWLGSSSAQVRFHGMCLRMQALLAEGRGEEALQLSRQLLLLVRSHRALATPGHHVQAQCQIAHAALQVGLPKMALEAVTSAPQQGVPPTHLQWQADLLAAEAMRMAQKYPAAMEAYRQLLETTARDPHPVRKAARRHLAAGAALQARQPLVALALLEGQTRLLNAHPDWEMANRLLHIMALIDCGQAEQAELRLDALRKSIPKLADLPMLQARYAGIVRLLQRWVHSGFDHPQGLGLTQVPSPTSKTLAGYPHAERVVFEEWWQENAGGPGWAKPAKPLAVGR